MTDEIDWVQRREHYRLPYPANERPEMRLNGKKLAVMEISEGGLKLDSKGCDTLEEGQKIACLISFRDGSKDWIEGSILRVNDETAVIQLTKGITMRRVMLEQARIKSKYPNFLRERADKRKPRE